MRRSFFTAKPARARHRRSHDRGRKTLRLGLDAPAANWEATADALERTAFLAKDAMPLIDDFVHKDGASMQDRARRYHTAERLIRRQRQPRRTRSVDAPSLRVRPEWHSRAMLTITGEDLPVGHSPRRVR